MRRYRKWVVTLGLVAAAPNVSLAGPFDFFRPKPGVSADGAYNQQVAEQIAAKLRSARLKAAEIEILYEDGTVTLKGQVADAGTKAVATQLAQSADGVRSVNNLMMVTGTGPIQQVGAQAPAAPAGANPFARNGIQSAAFEASAGQPSGIQQVAAAQDAAAQRQRTASAAPTAQAMRRPAPSAPQARPAAPAGVSNQQSAEQVAAALGRAGLSGYDIEVRCDNGICTLAGTVTSPAHRDAAIKAASTVQSVAKINPQLRVASAGPITPANYQDGGEGSIPPGYPMPGGYPGVAPGYPAGVSPPPPGWAHPGAGAVGGVYDQPNVPQYAWPNYAAAPNYAAVTYPRQYSASAWPYIGPFYPYPQVPLGWREVSLEWDDGHWFLDFNDRTDKWWWFMNPKNW